MKMLYSVKTKVFLNIAIFISICFMFVFGKYLLTTAMFEGGTGEWYDSSIIWDVEGRQISLADSWYEYYNKQLTVPLTLQEQDQFNNLTEILKNSSLKLVRVDYSTETKVGIAGFDYLNVSNSKLYEELNTRIIDDNHYYELYFDLNSGLNDEFVTVRNYYAGISQEKIYNNIIGLAVSSLLSVVFYILLLIGAGRKSTGELSLNCIHRFSFDVLSIIIMSIICVIIVGIEEMCYMYSMNIFEFRMYVTSALICFGYAVCLFWFHTFVARLKNHMLIKTTFCYKICSWFFGKLKYAFNKAGEKVSEIKIDDINFDDKKQELGEFYEKCHTTLNKQSNNIKKTAGIFKNSFDNISKSMSIVSKICLLSIPPILVIEFLIFLIFGSFLLGFIFFIADIFIFKKIYKFANNLTEIKNAGQHLAYGDLDYKIQLSGFRGELLRHAENLNAISDGMTVAVEERLKSERMKYELLTNVSHDIKTPLTSIINYVDLLKTQPISTPESQEYIDVLDRQSGKLKKLITDLIEVSKATTGNIKVNAVQMEVKELLTQCIGEYDSRLKEKKLEVVLNTPQEPVSILADGRLLWRVFDNLLSNVVKYAMPNTRVYIELTDRLDIVLITIKNISQSKLNISADELMERFVRGDSSRTTEGSGLGLSIAQSLTQLMKGQFSIEVDGDLFKITLKFNR